MMGREVLVILGFLAVAAFALWSGKVREREKLASACAEACAPAHDAAQRCAIELSLCHARNASPCLPTIGPVEAPIPKDTP